MPAYNYWGKLICWMPKLSHEIWAVIVSLTAMVFLFFAQTTHFYSDAWAPASCLLTGMHQYPPRHSISSVPDAGIVYLADFKGTERLEMLENSIIALQRFFLSTFPYPVILFYEPPRGFNLTEVMLRLERHSAHLHFHEIVGFRDIPDYLNASEITTAEEYNKYGFRMGYMFMCRFWAHGVFQQEAMRQLRYYWRLDTDLTLLQPIMIDPFAYMQANDLSYLHGALSTEDRHVVIWLWGTVLRFMRDFDIDLYRLQSYTNGNGDYNLLIFYNNFEVSRTRMWQTPLYSAFFTYLNRTGGILQRRWGDAPIRTLALAALFPHAKVEQWRGLCYFHAVTQRTY